MADGELVPLATKAIEKLGLSTEVRHALVAVQAELTAAYQKNFVEMLQAMRMQAAALRRLQTTLNLLIEEIAPKIKVHLPSPVHIEVAASGEAPDLASALVTADPIGAGFMLTQADLSNALNLHQTDVSTLVKAFNLREDENCAVVVRRGKRHDTVNYHPRAIQRFRELVAEPPSGLSSSEKKALARVARSLLVAPGK